MIKKILLTSLLVAASSANAAIVTQEASFGTQGSPFDLILGNLNQTLSFERFDSSLGDLQNVTVSLYGQIDTVGSSVNVSESNGRAGAGIYIFSDWKVSSNVGATHVFESASFSTPILSSESSPEGTFTLVSNTVNDTFNYALSTGLRQATLDNFDTNLFTSESGTNTIDFIFSTFANTNIDNDVQAGTGVFTNSFNSGTYGKALIEYNYTLVPDKESGVDAEVNAPATGMLLATSLAFIGYRRSQG